MCHVLQKLGTDFGDPDLFIDPEQNRHNPIFFELVSLNEINDEILAELGWSYRDFVATPLHEDFSSALADKFEARIASFLQSNFGESNRIGMKDPRFCFTLPLWMTVMGRLGIECQCLLTERDSEAVAASNFRLSPERGIEYSRRIVDLSKGAALYFLKNRTYQSVSFEELAASAPSAVKSLMAISGHGAEMVAQTIAEVFDRNLMHLQGDERSEPNSDLDLAEDYASLAKLVRKFQMPVGGSAASPPHARGSMPLSGHHLGTSFLLEKNVAFERGKVQLYFRSEAESYTEANSIVMPWPSFASTEIVEFNLPDDHMVNYIRLDLNDFPGAYAVQQLLIDGQALVPLQRATAGNGAVLELHNGNIGLVANHDDPWLEFSIPSGRAHQLAVKVQRLPLEAISQKIFEDPEFDVLLRQLHDRVSRIDDRVVGIQEHTVNVIAKVHGDIVDRIANEGVASSERAGHMLEQVIALQDVVKAEKNRSVFQRWFR
jgi:hypothetical protein